MEHARQMSVGHVRLLSQAVRMLSCILTCAATALSFEGTLLYADEGQVILHSTLNSTELVLLDGVGTKPVEGCFSPDGREIVADNSGGFSLVFCRTDGGAARDIPLPEGIRLPFRAQLHWFENGRVGWIGGEGPEWDRNAGPHNTFYTVDAQSGAFERVFVAPYEMSRSATFTRDATTAYDHVRWDLTGVLEPLHLMKFCAPAISGSGELITRGATGHELFYLDWRDTLEACCAVNQGDQSSETNCANECRDNSVYKTIDAHDVWGRRFAIPPHAGDDWLVATEACCPPVGQYVFNIRTEERYHRSGSGVPFDFWPGSLPTANTPILLGDRTTLAFTSGGPTSAEVTITNGSGGTLGTVSAACSESWVTAVVQGTGDTQTVTVTVDLGGLPDGVHQATLTIDGGGAPNQVSCTITATVGAALAPPSELVASNGVAGEIVLSWTDNSGNEDGFAIERLTGTGPWEQVAATPADTTSWHDTGLTGMVTYGYRVLSFKDTLFSAPSDSVMITMPAIATISIMSPAVSDVWAVGDTVRIRWTSQVTTKVVVELSTDGGETFTNLLLSRGGAVLAADSDWQDVAVVAPGVISSDCFVRVSDYLEPQLNDLAGPFSIADGSSVAGMVPSRAPRAAAGEPRRMVSTGGNSARTQGPGIVVYDLLGSCVTGQPGGTLPAGAYILRRIR